MYDLANYFYKNMFFLIYYSLMYYDSYYYIFSDKIKKGGKKLPKNAHHL